MIKLFSFGRHDIGFARGKGRGEGEGQWGLFSKKKYAKKEFLSILTQQPPPHIATLQLYYTQGQTWILKVISLTSPKKKNIKMYLMSLRRHFY